MQMARGRFISIEGGEGVGKTTQIAALTEALQARGFEVVRTREPGGTPRAERIRTMLSEHTEEPMPPTCELLLFFAARSSHVENVIKPALARGAWVICDRFIDSTYAYQAGGRCLDVAEIKTLESLALKDCMPDLTLLLDAPLEVGLARAAKRNAASGSVDRMELEKQAFFERVRAAYLERARLFPERITLIDASRDVESVRQSMWSAVEQIMPVSDKALVNDESLHLAPEF